MKFLKRFLAGISIGVGAAIPGVSGAALAVIFGVYEEIISAVDNFRKKFGYALKVLIPILLGIVCAIIPCIYLFSLAFEYLMFALICAFAGFLIGSLPGIRDEVKGVKPNKKQIIIAIIGAIFVILLGVLSVICKIDFSQYFDDINNCWWIYLLLIPVGVIAAVALTIPGLSGSLILLILGFYIPLLNSAKNWTSMALHGDWSMFGQLLGVLGCFAIGCIIGVAVVSKIMNKLLVKHHDSTFFGIIGFISGSIVVLFFNNNIYKYYLGMAGQTIDKVNPILPWYIEVIIGVVILVLTCFGSYMLVKAKRKRTAQAKANKEEKPNDSNN